jgi:hypothetical protein
MAGIAGSMFKRRWAIYAGNHATAQESKRNRAESGRVQYPESFTQLFGHTRVTHSGPAQQARSRRFRSEIPEALLLGERQTQGRTATSSHASRCLPRALALSVLLFLFAFSPRVSADAGVVLNESLDTSVARITGSGHSAIYLSRICPDDSPTKMRLCRPGEQGSVLSNYTTLGEDQPYEWNIVPLSIYLYGVEDPRNRPLVSSKEIKATLEERYREKYLAAICTGKTCLTGNGAEWREMVGATMERSMYMFVVKTSVEQDRALVAQFNALPNVNHFNGVTRNCADFARRVMNSYFPRAVNPDYINDFFMTTPKAVAHSLTRYAEEHSELDLRVLHFTQIPGTIKRSYECRSGTEEIYRSKKFVIPLAVFAWQGVPAAFSTYVLTGRFNPQHQFEAHASVDALGPDEDSPDAPDDITPEEVQRITGRTETISATTGGAASSDATISPSESLFPPEVLVRAGYTVSVEQLAAEQKNEQHEIVGTKDQWTLYQKQFPSIVEEAIREEIIPDHDYLKRVFKHLGQDGTVTADVDGSLWMSLPNEKIREKVGISASNIFADGSQSQFAYQIILARMEYELKSPKHSRETMLEFQRDWNLLTDARARGRAYAAARHSAGARLAAATKPAASVSATESAALN